MEKMEKIGLQTEEQALEKIKDNTTQTAGRIFARSEQLKEGKNEDPEIKVLLNELKGLEQKAKGAIAKLRNGSPDNYNEREAA